MNEAVTPERIMQVGLGFWASKTLLSAVEFGLFTELGEGAMTAEEIRAKLGLHPRSLRDFLDALVVLGFLERKADQYANTPETAQFLDKRKPTYMGGFLEMADARLYPFWGDLSEGLNTGEPQNELKHGGPDLFSALYKDPVKLPGFLRAMTGLSFSAHRGIAEKFPWERYRTLADIGTAEGGLPVEVGKTHGHVEGVGADLPEVQPVFEQYVEWQGVADRFTFQPLDFWKEELPGAEVLVMGHILHDWNMEEKLDLLSKAYRALPKGGALIVYEAIIDDDRKQNAFGLLMSLNMLIETRGGFDYTGAECREWMQKVGFQDTRVEHLAGPDSMVVGLK